MELAISLHAVAEWRDQLILSAVALLNQNGTEARAVLRLEIENATAAGPIFNRSALANSRNNALPRAALDEPHANQSTRPIALKVRQREATAIARGAPLAALEERAVQTREWLKAARSGASSPILFLPASLHSAFSID